MIDYDKLPPHSIESEQSVLGALLQDNDAMDRIAGQIGEEDFYRADHRLIWRQIARIIDANKPADVVTVAEALESSGQLDNAGGLAYLAEIAQNTPSTANIRRYAEIVRSRAIRRNLLAAITEIGEGIHNGDDITDLLEKAQDRILAIGDKTQTHVPVHVTEIARERLNVLDERFAGNDDGMSTGLTDVDEKLGKIRPGDLVVIAGRPGMGKSAYAMQLLRSMGTAEKPALFFSLEMSAGQLVDRMLSSEGRINLKKFRTADFHDEDWHGLTVAIGKINDIPLYIDDHSNSLGQIMSTMRTFKRRHGLGVVAIDYIGLVESSGDTREQEIARITRALKLAAKRFGCPIIALSQLNRKLEDRADKRPVMSDLRESGAIEQDADSILMLYRDEIYNPDSDHKGTCEVLIRKNRHGETGMVPVVFRADLVRFENFAGQYEQYKPMARRRSREDL